MYPGVIVVGLEQSYVQQPTTNSRCSSADLDLRWVIADDIKHQLCAPAELPVGKQGPLWNANHCTSQPIFCMLSFMQSTHGVWNFVPYVYTNWNITHMHLCRWLVLLANVLYPALCTPLSQTVHLYTSCVHWNVYMYMYASKNYIHVHVWSIQASRQGYTLTTASSLLACNTWGTHWWVWLQWCPVEWRCRALHALQGRKNTHVVKDH